MGAYECTRMAVAEFCTTTVARVVMMCLSRAQPRSARAGLEETRHLIGGAGARVDVDAVVSWPRPWSALPLLACQSPLRCHDGCEAASRAHFPAEAADRIYTGGSSVVAKIRRRVGLFPTPQCAAARCT